MAKQPEGALRVGAPGRRAAQDQVAERGLLDGVVVGAELGRRQAPELFFPYLTFAVRDEGKTGRLVTIGKV